jgi:hypothetical protein
MSKTLRELFVNRARQGDIFRRMLEGRTRRRIMVITAGAGMGKSWQLQTFAYEASSRGLPLVQIDFADGQAYDTLTLVRRCRDAFGPEHFNKLTEAINEATTARVALSTAEAAPANVDISIGSENSLTNSAVSVAEVGTIIKDNSFVIQTDNPLVRQAIEDRVNSAFFACLKELSEKTRLVFLFDTYERNSLEAERWLPSAADRWIVGQVLARMRDGKLDNTIVVIAGRRTPDFGIEWNEVLGRIDLEPLECSHVTEYLRERRGLMVITDAEAARLCQAVAGNPQVLGLIGDNLEQANKPAARDDEW